MVLLPLLIHLKKKKKNYSGGYKSALKVFTTKRKKNYLQIQSDDHH